MILDDLRQALQTLNAEDALRLRLDETQWLLLANHLTRQSLRSGAVLIEHHATDRVMHLVESGILQVFVPGPATARRPVAILRAGAVVGEPALFGETPRMAQVEAMAPTVVWSLHRGRLEELAQRQPELALEVLRACGAVMAVRMQANLDRGLPVA